MMGMRSSSAEHCTPPWTGTNVEVCTGDSRARPGETTPERCAVGWPFAGQQTSSTPKRVENRTGRERLENCEQLRGRQRTRF